MGNQGFSDKTHTLCFLLPGYSGEGERDRWVERFQQTNMEPLCLVMAVKHLIAHKSHFEQFMPGKMSSFVLD